MGNVLASSPPASNQADKKYLGFTSIVDIEAQNSHEKKLENPGSFEELHKKCKGKFKN